MPQWLWNCYRKWQRSRATADPLTKTLPDARSQESFWRFALGNQFEAENIWDAVFRGDEYRIRRERFTPDDVVIDIGAHIGVFSYLCYILGSRSIYCYEPSDRNFQFLQRNLGNYDGIELFNKAVWRSDSKCAAGLLLSGPHGDNTGAHSVMASGRIFDFPNQCVEDSSGEIRRVECVALDAVLTRFPRVRLLKLDCEGSEFPILFTSRKFHRVHQIVAEVHEIRQQAMRDLAPESRLSDYQEYRIDDLTKFLKSAGFDLTVRQTCAHMWIMNARRKPQNAHAE
jgi:FkbM family methyltransferase